MRHLWRVKSRAPADARNIEQILCSSASFHLAAPMIESRLFADPDGPARAGVPAAHLPPKLRWGHDPEDFQTEEPDYSSDMGQCCTATPRNALPPHGKKSATPEWLKVDGPHEKVKIQREMHPKRYMAWLCRSGAERNCSTYSDRAGAESLERLAWGRALGSPGHMRFLRAFLFDLSNALGSDPFGFSLAGDQSVPTSLPSRPRDHMLRNI